MFRYRLVDQRVPAMCLDLAAARLRTELPSGKAPTTRVRRRIFARDPLERIAGPDAALVLFRERVVRHGLGHGRLDQLGRFAELHAEEPDGDLAGLALGSGEVFLGMDCLEHQSHLAQLTGRHVTEDLR
jgi:hypothetical protein